MKMRNNYDRLTSCLIWLNNFSTRYFPMFYGSLTHSVVGGHETASSYQVSLRKTLQNTSCYSCIPKSDILFPTIRVGIDRDFHRPS